MIEGLDDASVKAILKAMRSASIAVGGGDIEVHAAGQKILYETHGPEGCSPPRMLGRPAIKEAAEHLAALPGVESVKLSNLFDRVYEHIVKPGPYATRPPDPDAEPDLVVRRYISDLIRPR